MPAGCPSGLETIYPEDGEAPSFPAGSGKYSALSGILSGDGDGKLVKICSLVDRSEFDREPRGRVARLGGVPDCKLGVLELESGVAGKFVPAYCGLGVPGEVAVGEKKGSIVGRVTAVCIAVRNRRGPTGLGIIMTSGKGIAELVYVDITD